MLFTPWTFKRGNNKQHKLQFHEVHNLRHIFFLTGFCLIHIIFVHWGISIIELSVNNLLPNETSILPNFQYVTFNYSILDI